MIKKIEYIPLVFLGPGGSGGHMKFTSLSPMKVVWWLVGAFLGVLFAHYLFGRWGFIFFVSGLGIHLFREVLLSSGREFEESEIWTDPTGRRRTRKTKGKEYKFPGARKLAQVAMLGCYGAALTFGVIHWIGAPDKKEASAVSASEAGADLARGVGSPFPSSSLVIDLGAGEEKRGPDLGPGISWTINSTKPFVAFPVMEETGARGSDHRIPAGDSGWGGETKKAYLVVRGLEPDTRIQFFRR